MVLELMVNKPIELASEQVTDKTQSRGLTLEKPQALGLNLDSRQEPRRKTDRPRIALGL
jgi:hypothetical protein